MIDSIIFDLDGVLAHTEHIHYNSLCDSIKVVTGLPFSEITALISTDGSTTKTKLAYLQKLFGWGNDIIEKIDARKQGMVLDQLKHIRSTPAQMEMLSSLSNNYKLAIGSNSRKHSVDTIVKAMGIGNFFQHIIAIEDINIPKPDPAIYNHTMALLGSSPTTTLIIEDSLKGIQAAQASGAHVLIATSVKETTLEFIQNELNKY